MFNLFAVAYVVESVELGEARTHAPLATIQTPSCVTPFNEIVFLQPGFRYEKKKNFHWIELRNEVEVEKKINQTWFIVNWEIFCHLQKKGKICNIIYQNNFAQ